MGLFNRSQDEQGGAANLLLANIPNVLQRVKLDNMTAKPTTEYLLGILVAQNDVIIRQNAALLAAAQAGRAPVQGGSL